MSKYKAWGLAHVVPMRLDEYMRLRGDLSECKPEPGYSITTDIGMSVWLPEAVFRTLYYVVEADVFAARIAGIPPKSLN